MDTTIPQQASKQGEAKSLKSGLYIIATPIGNLKDISERALEIIKLSELVICEDTRVTNRLLSSYGIKKSMIVYNDHSDEKERKKILNILREGKVVSLVSDAGTPLISDPGYKLVRALIDENIYFTTIPGPSSVISALVLSGLPSNRFLFEGFLPNTQKARREHLQEISGFNGSLIFFERAERLEETFLALLELLGNRDAAIVREISKTFEETLRGKLKELLQKLKGGWLPKGEIVIVVGPPEKQEIDSDTINKALKKKMKLMSVKDAVDDVSDELKLSRKVVYQHALEIKKNENS